MQLRYHTSRHRHRRRRRHHNHHHHRRRRRRWQRWVRISVRHFLDQLSSVPLFPTVLIKRTVISMTSVNVHMALSTSVKGSITSKFLGAINHR